MSSKTAFALLLTLFVALATPALAQQPTSKAQTALSQAAEQGKYTFILFYKANDAATTAMNTTLQTALAKYKTTATFTFVYVADPNEQELVKKYDVSRAPMPLTLAIAPNGALTGMFPQKIEATHVDSSFVTPTMMQAMKALQENKLVFVTVQGNVAATEPVALREFASDPHFNTRMVTLTANASDPAEAKFMAEMEVDPRIAATQLSLLAPPGVLVGKFPANTPMKTIAAALAEAGKCCDDPNCKHHQQQQAQPQPNRGATAPATGARR
jgi:hypothetical protein